MRHILLTWNPGPADVKEWDPLEWQEEMVEPTARGESAYSNWSVGRLKNNIEPGDRAYLYRQGEHGRGLVALGEIQSVPYPAASGTDRQKTMNYVEVRWTNCRPVEDRISVDVLEAEIPEFKWKSVYNSGREVKPPHGDRLARLWGQPVHPEDPTEPIAGEPEPDQLFGDPEQNRKVELAAMDAVTQVFEDEGYVMKDVSARKCGWDITARLGSEELHLEVKGVSGRQPSILLTANEHRVAQSDEQWQLVVVTNALGEALVHEYDRNRVVELAAPYVYRVRLDDE